MATVTFFDGHRRRTITVSPPAVPAPGAAEPERPTLLDLARAHGIPMLFCCTSGDCGACRVEVRYPEGRPATVQPPTPQEKLHQAASRLAHPPAPGAEVRLACQYHPGDETLEVTFPSFLGAM